MGLKELFLQTKNYAIYYGIGCEKELSAFDIAIVEPAGHDREGISRLKASGTLVFAYLSITEINPTFPVFKLLKQEDFLYKDGKPLINKNFGNYIADMRSKRWNEILLHTAGSLLYKDGYDGLFLDTVNNVEIPEILSSFKDSQIRAVTSFMNRLKESFPEYILIQNNGLEKLCEFTAGIVDGICWENPPFGKSESKVWTDEITDRLEIMSKNYNTKVMLLLEGNKSEREDTASRIAAKLAKDNNYLIYIAPPDYVSCVNPL